MLSVKLLRRGARDEGWEWRSETPRRRSFGPAVAALGLLATGWLAWPADAAKRWDDTQFLSPQSLVGWSRQLEIEPVSPDFDQVSQWAQTQGGGPIVPPVKRHAPQMPSPSESAPAVEPVQPKATQPSPTETAQPAPQMAQPAPEPDREPAPAASTAEKAPKRPQETAQSPPAAGEPSSGWRLPSFESITAPVTEWFARANREYQDMVVKELSRPSSTEAESERLAAEKGAREQAERERASRDRAARQAEEARQAAKEEAARRVAARETEARRQAEAKQQAAAQKEAARKAEADNAASGEGEARRQQEAARLAEEQKGLARRQELERQEQAHKEKLAAERLAREAKLAEEQRVKEEQRRAKAQAQTAAQPERVATAAKAPAATARPPASQRHRRWSVTIIPEPIERAGPAPVSRPAEANLDKIREPNAVLMGSRRLEGRMGLGAGSLRGPAVKRWIWRAGNCRMAGHKMHRNVRYTVARGDSLWRISEKYYEAGRKYPRIYRANKDRIADPDMIYPCQKFRVPKR